MGCGGQKRYRRCSVGAHATRLRDTAALRVPADVQTFLEPSTQDAARKLTRVLVVDEQNLYEPEVEGFRRQRGLTFGRVIAVDIRAGVSGQAQLHEVLIKLQEGVWSGDRAEFNGFSV